MATKCVVNKSTMTGIADAIRAKGGTSDTLLPSEMPAAIQAIPSGGGIDEDFVAGVFGRSLVGDWDVSMPAGSSLRAYAIGSVTTSFSLVLRGVQSVYDNAFRSSKITSVSLPDLNISYGYAFYNCTTLREIRLVSPTSIQQLLRIDAGSTLTDVYITGKTADEILALQGFPGYSGTSQQPNEANLTFHGSDADVKLINGSWVKVER